jgi:hypothetical protein
VLLTDLKREKGRRLWQRYHERGGTIEEYNDPSERASHLEVMRTGHFDGRNALEALIGLCWDLTAWALAELRLPPVQGPAAERERWVAALRLDLAAVRQRAALSGLRLYRAGPGAVLRAKTQRTPPRAVPGVVGCNSRSNFASAWQGNCAIARSESIVSRKASRSPQLTSFLHDVA